MKPLRTGIIGCGNIAKRHAEILRSLEDACLVGFCDTNLLAARQFADHPNPSRHLSAGISGSVRLQCHPGGCPGWKTERRSVCLDLQQSQSAHSGRQYL